MNGTVNFTIPKTVHDKIMYWVHKADFEVSGFGTVTYEEKKKEFTLEDAFLVKQEGTSTTTDICAKDLGKAMYEVHKRGLKGTLNFWWHSHVNMATFWSSTDRDTIKEIGANGWCIATVFNKKEEMRTAFCAKKSIAVIGDGLEFVDEVPTKVQEYFDPEEQALWDKDYLANVTEKTYKFQMDFSQAPSYTHPQGSTLIDTAWNRGKSRHEIEWPTDPTYVAALRAEAKLLKMSYKQYVELVNYGSYQELEDIELKLELAMAQERTKK